MLEKIDLTKSIKKSEYKNLVHPLREKLGELQRTARNAGLPILILFEGWDASGKGVLMNELILPLDPRGFRVHNVSGLSESEKFWPPLYPFWHLTPPKGWIHIFNKSWYRDVMVPGKHSRNILSDILAFEKQLTDADNLIVKFFLHISKKEQARRLKKLDENSSSTWRVSKKEWDNHHRYHLLAKIIEETILRTDKEYAPWTIIEAENKEYATVKLLTTVTQALESQIQRVTTPTSAGTKKTVKTSAPETTAAKGKKEVDSKTPDSILAPSILKNIDLNKTITEKKYHKELAERQEQFRDLQYRLYSVRRPMVIVFEGQDAAGKGGCIKRLTQKLDPRGYQVNPTAAPNDWERAHHYLWRFWMHFPKAGHVAIYDRSWYGRVLVERVEGFCSEKEWRRAYEEINEMEDQWIRYGAILLKFWLQIDSNEQIRRFEAREKDPEKNWKITPEDWRNRAKEPLYEEAAEEMMLRTSTASAPWVIVEANDKPYARIKVLNSVVDTLKTALGE